MSRFRSLPAALFCLLALCFFAGCAARDNSSEQSLRGVLTGSSPATLTLNVDGLSRIALIYAPPSPAHSPLPVLLAFHGFGSSAADMESLAQFELFWPQAIVVYPQGLNVLKPSTGTWEPGWPDNPGQYHDRDMHFVTALLAALRSRYSVAHFYATGYSNGATFTNLLYTQQPNSFAAFAGVAGPATFLANATVSRPLLFISGEEDPYVDADLAATMLAEFCRVNQCGPRTKSWPVDPAFTVYLPSSYWGAPLIWLRHSEGHLWPSDATQDIVAFFKEY